MSFVINTNVGSVLSTQHLGSYARKVDSAVVSIATGKRINTAGDFLKGESLANSFMVQSSALKNSLSSIKNGLSLADAAEKALQNSQNMLQSMRELAVQSSNGTYLPRTGKAMYSKSNATFSVTAGTNGRYASGSIRLTGATEGANSSGSLRFSGAHAGTQARATLLISGAVAGTNAQGYVRISGGTADVGNTIDSITIDGGSNILTSAITHTGNNSTTAEAVKNAISAAGFTASRSGANVYITSTTKDSAQDGGGFGSLAVTTSGDVTTTKSDIQGGVTTSQTTISGLTIDGGSNLLGGVPLSVSGDTAAIASAIQTAFSSGGHTATVSSNRVIITSNTKDSSQNDDVINLTMSNVGSGTAATSNSGLTLTGGYTPTTTTVSSVTVAGINGGNNLLNSGSITVTGDSTAIATAVAADISNSAFSSVYRSGSSVNFVRSIKTAAENGNTIQGSSSNIAGASSASITSGSLSGGDDTSINTISAIKVAGTNILAGNVSHTGGNTGTATTVKNAINANSATSGYRAESSGATITITATDKDTTDNGDNITMTRLSNGEALNEVSQGTVVNFSGGDTPSNNAFTEIRVNGVKINNNPILHTENNSTTAAAISAEINATTSTPRNYTASSSGANVTIYSDTIAYWEDNDKSLSVTSIGTAAHNNDNSNAILDGSVRLDGGAVVYINNRIKDVILEVDDQMQNASHNKLNLFTGNTLSFVTGKNIENTISAPTFSYTALDSDTLDLTVNATKTSLTYIDTTLENIRSVQSQYAAFSNRLEHEMGFLSDAVINTEGAMSKIIDSDIAGQTAQLMKYKFLEDAAISVYMQSRFQKRDVLKLYYDQFKVEGQGKMFL